MAATHPSRLDRAAPYVVAAALAFSLALAYAGKAVCLDGEDGFWGLTRYCYSDVRVLWDHRGFDAEALPYAGPPDGYATEYTFEYPPGLAFPAWMISLVTETRRGFFNLHAVTFVAAGIATTGFLAVVLRAGVTRRDGDLWRLLGFALSPGLVLFGMQNWDLWPVAVASAGLAAAATRRSVLAGALFGLAAAIKWWPALLLVVVVAGPWRSMPRDDDADTNSHAEALAHRIDERLGLDPRPVVVAAAVWLVVQLPALMISPSGWLASVTFHLRRRPNYDSTAAALSELGSSLVPGAFWGEPFAFLWTGVSLAVLVVGLVYVVARLRSQTIHPGDAALAVLGIFLVTGKVFSPQFVVWLVPVAVVATVAWAPVIAVEAANAAVWLLYGPWMAHWHEGPEWWGFLYAAQGASVLRTLTLVWLVAAALRRRGASARG